MKINIEILKQALVHNVSKIENLNEKQLVKKMMVRRRLTRNSKILINLAYQCEFLTGTMIYGSAYGEVLDTVSILNSINNNEAVSPTSFQNSVYNTAASYHSIIHVNKAEILTLSCGDNTSYNVMQQAALSACSNETVFACVTEAINFEGVEQLNKCANELEYGIAFKLKKTDDEATLHVDSIAQEGVPNSLAWMKSLYDVCANKEKCIFEIEL